MEGKGQGRKGNGEGCSPQTKIYHYTNNNNNDDRLTAFDPGQPG